MSSRGRGRGRGGRRGASRGAAGKTFQSKSQGLIDRVDEWQQRLGGKESDKALATWFAENHHKKTISFDDLANVLDAHYNGVERKAIANKKKKPDKVPEAIPWVPKAQQSRLVMERLVAFVRGEILFLLAFFDDHFSSTF